MPRSMLYYKAVILCRILSGNRHCVSYALNLLTDLLFIKNYDEQHVHSAQL